MKDEPGMQGRKSPVNCCALGSRLPVNGSDERYLLRPLLSLISWIIPFFWKVLKFSTETTSAWHKVWFCYGVMLSWGFQRFAVHPRVYRCPPLTSSTAFNICTLKRWDVTERISDFCFVIIFYLLSAQETTEGFILATKLSPDPDVLREMLEVFKARWDGDLGRLVWY